MLENHSWSMLWRLRPGKVSQSGTGTGWGTTKFNGAFQPMRMLVCRRQCGCQSGLGGNCKHQNKIQMELFEPTFQLNGAQRPGSWEPSWYWNAIVQIRRFLHLWLFWRHLCYTSCCRKYWTLDAECWSPEPKTGGCYDWEANYGIKRCQCDAQGVGCNIAHTWFLCLHLCVYEAWLKWLMYDTTMTNYYGVSFHLSPHLWLILEGTSSSCIFVCVSCCIFVCVCSVVSGDLASIVVVCVTHARAFCIAHWTHTKYSLYVL